MKATILLAILLVGAILLPTMIVKADETVISISDPEGDDKGPGYYGYPTNAVFKEGVYDALKFEVITTDRTVIFKVYLKDLGDNPWGGPNGFCLQNIQIYVHTTMSGVPSRMDTLGLNIGLRSDYSWHFAIIMAPGWEESPVPQGQRSALYFANGTVIAQDGAFQVYIDNASNAIVAEIDDALLPDLDNIGSWKIVVGVASYDGFGPMRVRPAGVTGGEWVLNATRNANSEQLQMISKAIAAGIEPRVLDLMVYAPDKYPNGITAEEQYAWLSSFNVDEGALALVPFFKPVTVTETSTTTMTTTKTETTTQTTTWTTTETSTTTQVQTVTDWTMAGIIGVVLLIIGVIAGYALGKR